MADEKKQPEPPSHSEPEKTPESGKTMDRDGGERQPTHQKDQK